MSAQRPDITPPSTDTESPKGGSAGSWLSLALMLAVVGVVGLLLTSARRKRSGG